MSEPYTETHEDKRRVGECPACKYPLFADITLTTELSPPRWSETLPAPHADVSVRVTGMALQHECGDREQPSRLIEAFRLAAPSCHCGSPIAFGFDGDPTHSRGLCEPCDSARCDAYPGECGR